MGRNRGSESDTSAKDVFGSATVPCALLGETGAGSQNSGVCDGRRAALVPVPESEWSGFLLQQRRQRL